VTKKKNDYSIGIFANFDGGTLCLAKIFPWVKKQRFWTNSFKSPEQSCIRKWTIANLLVEENILRETFDSTVIDNVKGNINPGNWRSFEWTVFIDNQPRRSRFRARVESQNRRVNGWRAKFIATNYVGEYKNKKVIGFLKNYYFSINKFGKLFDLTTYVCVWKRSLSIGTEQNIFVQRKAYVFRRLYIFVLSVFVSRLIAQIRRTVFVTYRLKLFTIFDTTNEIRKCTLRRATNVRGPLEKPNEFSLLNFYYRTYNFIFLCPLWSTPRYTLYNVPIVSFAVHTLRGTRFPRLFETVSGDCSRISFILWKRRLNRSWHWSRFVQSL